MNNISEEDLFSAGFKKIDPAVISEKPPMIQWGEGYKKKTSFQKISYLEKLASSMNHAAFLIQKERDELNILIQLKEKQLIKLNFAVSNNNDMLQQEVTRMNEQRQGYNQEVSRLNGIIRELKSKTLN